MRFAKRFSRKLGRKIDCVGLHGDAVPLIGGKAAWSYQDARSEWDAYGECVRQVGLQWAGDWTQFREYPHAQLRSGGNPLKQYGPDEIQKMLQEHNLI